MTNPYHRFHLWRNPFGELTREERVELAVLEPFDEWLQHLAHPRSALQFVGNCGHGKTTRLLAIRQRLKMRPGQSTEIRYVYYPEDGPRPRLPKQRPIVIDEAQRMGFWQQRRMFKGEGPLVLASHVDLTDRLSRAGFGIMTISLDQPMPPLTLAKILNRRIEASRLDTLAREPFVLHIDEFLAERLLKRFGSNVREIEHFLYLALQHWMMGKSTWPPAL